MFDAGKTRMIGLLHGEKVGRYVKPFSSDTGTLQTDRQTDRFATTILNFKKIIFGHRLSNLGHAQQLTSRIDRLDSIC